MDETGCSHRGAKESCAVADSDGAPSALAVSRLLLVLVVPLLTVVAMVLALLSLRSVASESAEPVGTGAPRSGADMEGPWWIPSPVHLVSPPEVARAA